MSPPFAENGALHLEALDVFVVVRHGHGRNHFVSDEPNRRAARRIPADLLRISVEIARRSLPVLSLPLVHVHPHRVAVGPRKASVDVHERLRPVLPTRQIAQALHGMPERRRVDHGARSGGEGVDIDAEEWNAGLSRLLDRRSRSPYPADRHVYATRDRLGARRAGNDDLETLCLECTYG